jgi:hypothetical protein
MTIIDCGWWLEHELPTITGRLGPSERLGFVFQVATACTAIGLAIVFYRRRQDPDLDTFTGGPRTRLLGADAPGSEEGPPEAVPSCAVPNMRSMASERAGFRYRLSPIPEQGAALERWAGCARAVYNAALEQRRTAYRMGQRATWAAQDAELSDADEREQADKRPAHRALGQGLRRCSSGPRRTLQRSPPTGRR